MYLYKYNGKEYQDELGLNVYDYGWRNYDPAIGRWVNIDPLLNELKFHYDNSSSDDDDQDDVYMAVINDLELGGGIYNTLNLNPYSYGYNNPVSFDDPDGRCPWCLLGLLLLIPEPAGGVSSAKDAKAFGEAKAAKGEIIMSLVTPAGATNATAGTILKATVKNEVKKTVTEQAKKNIEKTLDTKKVEKVVTEKPVSTSRAGKPFTTKEKQKVIDANASKNNGEVKCEGCGVTTTKPSKSERGVTPPKTDRQIDHIEPKSKGGSGTAENGQVLCRTCNREKSDNK